MFFLFNIQIIFVNYSLFRRISEAGFCASLHKFTSLELISQRYRVILPLSSTIPKLNCPENKTATEIEILQISLRF